MFHNLMAEVEGQSRRSNQEDHGRGGRHDYEVPKAVDEGFWKGKREVR
jgi:hypothetical protein